MIRPLSSRLLALLTACGLCGACGCGSSASPAKPVAGGAAPAAPHAHDHEHGDHDHDHAGHDHAATKTIDEAVAELRKVIQDVAAKLASGANDAADDAVHDVGHLLEDLDTLVGKQDVAADVKEATKKAVAELMDCFDKVDQAMHASKDEGESPSAVHASVTERIAAAMASLEKQIKGRKTPTEHKE